MAGVCRANSQLVINTMTIASASPIAGERKIAATILSTPDQTIAEAPALAMPAPISPPTSAWLDEEGIPSAQVMRFQPIAPIRAPKTTWASTMSAEIVPLPIV